MEDRKKKRIAGICILSACCVPYAFMALWADAFYGTMMMYIPMAAAFLLFCAAAVRRRSLMFLIAGNGISFVSSCVALSISGLEQNMGGYFKPFTAQGLVILVSVISLAVQMIIFFINIRKQNSR